MEDLQLSFIVPVYNAANYLPECLDSLLDQGMSADTYEIICVNDGSKDDSLAVLQRYAQIHPNIVIVDKENGGVTTARNAGLEKARGAYVWFVDSDDFLKRRVLPRLLAELREHDCDRLVIGCYIFDDVLTDAEKEHSENGTLPLNGPGKDSICVRSLMRRSFLKEHGLYFSHPELTHGEDGMFMYEVCGFEPTEVLVDEAIYFYRIHSGSAETAESVPSLLKKLRSYTRIVELLGEYYASGRKDPRTANTYMNFLWFALLTTACLPPRESRNARKQLRKAGLFPSKRLPECDLTCSYMVSTESLVGKIYDRLYLNLHTPWGYAGIWLVRQLLRIKRSLHK